jgi:hypothetical protein
MRIEVEKKRSIKIVSNDVNERERETKQQPK